MTESLYMDAIEEVLQKVEEIASNFDPSCRCYKCLSMRQTFMDAKADAIEELVNRYHLDSDDAQAHVAVAAGEEP